MIEEWRPIKDFEGMYEVSNTGKVRGLDRVLRNGHIWIGKELAHSIKYDGYHKVTLMKDNKSYYYSVHRLVAEAFIPNPLGLPQVNHKDEDPANNNVDNLEWCDNDYNQNYGTRAERIANAQRNAPMKSQKIYVDGIGEFPSIKEFCRQFNLNYSGVKGAICNNRPYKNYNLRRI